MSILAERLKMARNNRKLTQRELASKLNLSQSSIALWETGDRTPDPDTISRLADFYNTSTDYLLGRTDDPSPQVSSQIVPEEILAELEEVIENQNIKFTVNGKVLDPEDDKMVRDMLRIAAERAKSKHKDLT